jgi:predicted ATPase/Tfp pilus assembly protein PilF
MGVVFEAFDPVLERHVALKFLPERSAADPEARDRILHEARALAALDHPNVGTVHDVEVGDDGRPFIVLALHRGATLAQRVVPLPWREAVALVLDAAAGLAHAHAAGVVHGDVKPANLLRTRDGTLKLVDFGLAGVAQRAAIASRGLGTLEYMAPEVLRGQPATAASDVWSLAVVAFELLTGVGPFRADSTQEVVRRVLEEEPPAPSALEVSLPEGFDAVIAAALAKRPEARTAAVAGFAAALRGAVPKARSPRTSGRSATPRHAVRPATELVGRAEERARVRAHLAEDHGVWLHGLGGVGKSRLALEIAFEEAARGRYADGVVVVDLAACEGSDDVAMRVATALGFPAAAADPWRALTAGIGASHLLLVLDEVDRIAPGWAHLETLVAACPNVRVLATAHTRHAVAGFRPVALGGLAVPPEGTTDPSVAAAYEAVRLFVDVGRRMQPWFELDADATPPVVALCRRVEGLPMALELVASLVRAAPLATLADAVGEDLDLLELATPDQKTTLAVVLGQSWRHLGHEVRALAERIAVFEGSFDWAAARAVADASVTELGRLVDASLLSFGRDGRYTMHPLVRRFVRSRLDPSSVADADARHGRHVLGWLGRLSAALRGPDQRAALAEVARGLADVEVAWGWAARVGDVALLASCADPLRLFYDRSGRVARGVRTMGAGAEVPVVAVHLAWLRMLLGDGDAAEALAKAGLRALGDGDEHAGHTATGWSTLGAVAAGRGEFDVADGHFRRALAIAERLGDDGLAARSLDNLASVADGAGRADVALQHYERGLAVARRAGNDAQVAVTLNNLGAVHLSAGRSDVAFEALDEALAIARRIDLDRSLPFVLANLAEAARAMGRWDEAMVYADEAARRADRLGDERMAAAARVEFAFAAVGRGGVEEARSAVRRAVAPAWASGDRTTARRAVDAWAAVETAAGRPGFAAWWDGARAPDPPGSAPKAPEGGRGDDALEAAVTAILAATSESVTPH